MAQKQLEKKMEANEKEMLGLKEIFNLYKNIEKLTKGVRESTVKKNEGSMLIEGLQQKMKGKMYEEAESFQNGLMEVLTKVNIRNLRCPFLRVIIRNHGSIVQSTSLRSTS